MTIEKQKIYYFNYFKYFSFVKDYFNGMSL